MGIKKPKIKLKICKRRKKLACKIFFLSKSTVQKVFSAIFVHHLWVVNYRAEMQNDIHKELKVCIIVSYYNIVLLAMSFFVRKVLQMPLWPENLMKINIYKISYWSEILRATTLTKDFFMFVIAKLKNIEFSFGKFFFYL